MLRIVFYSTIFFVVQYFVLRFALRNKQVAYIYKGDHELLTNAGWNPKFGTDRTNTGAWYNMGQYHLSWDNKLGLWELDVHSLGVPGPLGRYPSPLRDIDITNMIGMKSFVDSVIHPES